MVVGLAVGGRVCFVDRMGGELACEFEAGGCILREIICYTGVSAWRVCVVLEGRRKRKSGERKGEREGKKGRREEGKGEDILSGSPMLWTTVMSYLLRIPGVASGVSGASYSDRE